MDMVDVPSGHDVHSFLLKMAIEIVSFPKEFATFHTYARLPEDSVVYVNHS